MTSTMFSSSAIDGALFVQQRRLRVERQTSSLSLPYVRGIP